MNHIAFSGKQNKYLCPIRWLILILVTFIFNTGMVQSQSQIQGPREVCVGECVTYIPIINNTNILGIEYVNVNLPGQPANDSCHRLNIKPEGRNFEVCFFCPGAYSISGLFFGNNNQTYFDSIQVFVNNPYPIQIVPADSISCGNSPGSACQRVCAGTTRQYKILNGPVGTNLISWAVTGAASFNASGDLLTVSWGQAGSGNINAFNNINQLCFEAGSFCVDISKELKPEFSLPKKEICVNETLELIPDFLMGSKYEWDFGNGEKSNDIKPKVAFDAPGIYTITLYAEDECGCKGIFTREIIVKELFLPTIDCKSTICENTPVTYQTDADCSSFFWKVIGDGKITDGGGTTDKFISINWGNGPLGIVELEVGGCNFDKCPQKAVFEIPIISKKALVSGQSIVCENSVEVYSIQKYGATEYFWQVDGGNITAGQGSHTIIVQWTNTVSGNIKVDFDNCYLKCGGSSSLNINIKKTYRLSAPDQVCTGDDITVQALNESNMTVLIEKWSISSSNGSVLFSDSNKANISFSIPGGLDKIIVQSASQSYCNGVQNLEIDILPKSKNIIDIEGEKNICAGIEYVYKINSDLHNAVFTWKIKDGNNETIRTGKDIVVKWISAGPYILEATQLDLIGSFCASDPFILALNELSSMLISAKAESCLYDQQVISAPDYMDMKYTWTISPSDAGTLINDEGHEIEVLWSKTGLHTINLKTCAGDFFANVNVLALPEPIVNNPATLCEDVLINVTTVQPYSKYRWFDQTGILISDLPDPLLQANTYGVEVTDPKGCKGKVNFTIDLLPKPNIFLSTPDDNEVCLSASPVFPLLYALDAEDGYSYRWLADGNLQPSTSNTFQTSSIGQYTVEVVDAFGCTNVSNTVTVYDKCDINNPPPPPPGGTIQPCFTAGAADFSFSALDCNSFLFNSLSTGNTGSDEKWYFDDIGVTDYPAAGQAIHHFSNAGYFKVYLLSGYNDINNPGQVCYKAVKKTIEVPVKAAFDFNNGCEGESMQFYDRSTFIPGKDITSWSWDFGDPASGTANTSSLPDPTHVFNADGQYIVKLTISNGSCTEEITQLITLYKKPFSTLSFPEGICEKENLSIVLDSLANDYFKVDWNFDDVLSGDNNIQNGFIGYHTFEQDGTYLISADIETVFGCKNKAGNNVNIVKNTLAGSITSSEGNTFCEGLIATLSSPVNGVSWLWNTAATTSSIQIADAGVYLVSMTNADGCTYQPAPITININPAPRTIIGTDVYDDTESLVGFGDQVSFCVGKNMKIFTSNTNGFQYLWSTGFIAKELEYSDRFNNQLIAGNFPFSLNTTDPVTGCQSKSNTINVKVNNFEGNVQITSNATGTMCEGIEHQMSVANPITGINYQWSNGKKTTAILTEKGGSYFVIAKDQNGCEAKSNVLEVFTGPDATLVPSGCFERCGADTLCFPVIQGVENYQWFQGNDPIQAMDGGQLPYIILNQSGSYSLEMLGVNGCKSKSEPLTLDVKSKVGVIKGRIYSDINGNNIIDSQDTLIAGIKVGIPGWSSISDKNGAFLLDNITGGIYSVIIDPKSLGAGAKTIIDSLLAKIITCNDTVHLDFLVGFDCVAKTDKFDFRVCFGQSIQLNGISFVKDTIIDFLRTNSFGCVDTMRYGVKFTDEIKFGTEAVPACPGQADGKIIIQTNAQNNYQYLIGNAVIGLQNNTILKLKADDYLLKVKDKNGCVIERKIIVEEKPELQLTLDHTNISCNTGKASVQVASSNYDFNQLTFLWSNGATTRRLDVFEKGNINVKVSNGCETVEKTVYIEGYKFNHQYKKFIICSGKSYEFQGETYVNDTLIYRTLVNAEGCIDTTIFDLRFGKKFLHTLDIDGNCPGKSDGQIRIINAVQGLTYLLNGNIVTPNNGIITNLLEGKYILQVKDDLGCEQKSEVVIAEKEKIDFKILSEDITCFKGFATLKVELENYEDEDIFVKWSNGATGISTNIGNAGTITAEISNGCYAEQESVSVVSSDLVPEFKLPHLFNPDLTGNQPILDLKLADLEDAVISGFNIFDRAGRLVYTSKTLSWDATGSMPEGLYYYRLIVDIKVCGEQKSLVRSGTFTLIK